MPTYTHRVRYHEVDQQGFLFNGRYLEIADVAFAEYFRGLGYTYPQLNELGFDPSVVQVTAEFQAPARYDDDLVVDVTCTRVGTSSFVLKTLISRASTPIASLNIVHVNVDVATEKSLPIPEKIAQSLQANVEPQEVAS